MALRFHSESWVLKAAVYLGRMSPKIKSYLMGGHLTVNKADGTIRANLSARAAGTLVRSPLGVRFLL